MNIRDKIKDKIVLALDVENFDQARELITEFRDYVGIFKVGLQLYCSLGNEIIDFMNENNLRFFLDVKLLDIPNTVSRAVTSLARRNAVFFNVHTLGGKEMMMRAKQASVSICGKRSLVLGVTMLTSIDEIMLKDQFGINFGIKDYVIKLAKLAKSSGLDGVVASVNEVKRIKSECGSDFKVLCPGIRLSSSGIDDQKRVATPSFAIQEGADFLVIGRTLTQAQNRIEAIKKIYSEIESVLTTDLDSSIK